MVVSLHSLKPKPNDKGSRKFQEAARSIVPISLPLFYKCRQGFLTSLQMQNQQTK